MAFNNLITHAISLELDNILKLPTVCDLGNQSLKNDTTRKSLFAKYNIDKKVFTTKQFYEALGFTEYLAIDVNKDMDATPMDLNLDLEKEYKFTNTYGLVTNAGTGEHIFNQYTVFKNIHSLCKHNGYMIHVLPFTGWKDHGFYNFNPNLFTALAKHNMYKLHHLFVADSNGKTNSTQENLLLVVIMQKTNTNKFNIPQQSRYAGNHITDPLIAARYNI